MFHLCTLAVGLVTWCDATGYTGSAPVERGGHVLECTLAMGQVTTCSLPHTGLITLPRGEGGKYVSCHVDHGFVTRCDATGANGEAILETR